MNELIKNLLKLPNFSDSEWKALCEILLHLEESKKQILEVALEKEKILITPTQLSTMADWTNPWPIEVKNHDFKEFIDENELNISADSLSQVAQQVNDWHNHREKDFHDFVKKENIKLHRKQIDRINQFINAWPQVANDLVKWCQNTSNKWEEIVIGDPLTVEELLPVMISLIPDTLNENQLTEIQKKLDQVSYLQKMGAIASAIINFCSAFSAKLKGDNPDNLKSSLYQIRNIYVRYKNKLSKHIQNDTKEHKNLLDIYYCEMHENYTNILLTQEEIQYLKEKHPDFILNINKIKLLDKQLCYLETPKNDKKKKKNSEKFVEFHKEFLASMDTLLTPSKIQPSNVDYCFNYKKYHYDDTLKKSEATFSKLMGIFAPKFIDMRKEVDNTFEVTPASIPTPNT